ncbi:MAG: hypothetical protein NTU94_16895 [Planctomycetota bacterium]|nr:hypothetical protein [Planctomycetota bacterium]
MPLTLYLQILLAGCFVIAAGLGLACKQEQPPNADASIVPTQSNPVQTVGWAGRGGGRIERGCSGETIWGVSGAKGIEVLESWKWQADLLVKGPQADISKVQGIYIIYDVCVTGGGVYLAYEVHADTIPLVARDLRSLAEKKRWPGSTSEEYMPFMNSSTNGKYAALAFARQGGVDALIPRYRIRLLDVAVLAMSDVMVLGGDQPSENNVRQVIPSDEGAYIAVAGWDNGVAMIDAKQKKLLWSKRPPSAISLTYAVFGPGNEVVYAGGGEGCVYEMAVRDGEVLGRWFASATGKSEYGHRISAIAVSPDGKYVAAGTGPEGLVFVIEPKTGKTVKVLNHGGSTVALVHFSPDSKRLASYAMGTLKVWGIAEVQPAGDNHPASGRLGDRGGQVAD